MGRLVLYYTAASLPAKSSLKDRVLNLFSLPGTATSMLSSMAVIAAQAQNKKYVKSPDRAAIPESRSATSAAPSG